MAGLPYTSFFPGAQGIGNDLAYGNTNNLASTQTQGQSTEPYSTSNNPTNVDPTSITANPQQLAGFAPAPIQSFGATAQVAPSYANAAYTNPNQNLAYLQQYEALTNAGLQPTFQQQQEQLQEQLAARGISNTGAAGYLEGNLLGQQGATLASQYAPLVSQAYGYTQQDLTGNTANQQAANFANQQAANAASQTNAGYYNSAVNQNYDAYNQYLQSLLGYGVNEQNALLSAYLNSFGANTGVTNVLSQGLYGTQNAYNNTYQNALGQGNQNAFSAAAAFGGA